MKQLAVLLLTVGGICASCTSEYEERLSEGRNLKQKLLIVEQSNSMMSDKRLSSEIEELKNEIHLLAKVSGNEELFLREIFAD